MDVFHTNKGNGDNSYAKNSLVQRTALTLAGPVLEESVREMYDSLKPDCIMIADMGCSSGPNALQAVSQIVDIIDEASRSINRICPQLGVFLNDLPGNDFNALFSLVPSFDKAREETKGSNFRPCFVSGIPKSFYGRVFPDNFLHLVHSTYSVHWLSQVPGGLVSENVDPLNKGHIPIVKEIIPKEVCKAYYSQFKRDFTLFLRSRSREMVSGGCMVLLFLARHGSSDSLTLCEVFGLFLKHMVAKGAIDQEKLDMFNIPMYLPTVEEVTVLVEAEETFSINKLETSTLDWSVDTSESLENRAKFVSKNLRVVIESLVATAFGQSIMDDLFLKFEKWVKEPMAEGRSEHLNIVLSVTKKD